MESLFGGPAPWFTAPAILGTGFLLVQIVMGEIGGDLDADVDDPGSEAKWLSLQTVAAFLVGFGWIGLAALRLFDIGFGGAAFVGVGAGLGVAWLLVQLTRLLLKLQSDANVSLSDAVGLDGSVCVIVPPRGGGSGRVAMVIRQSRHEFNAVQQGETPIASHTPVRVVDADRSSNTLVVTPA